MIQPYISLLNAQFAINILVACYKIIGSELELEEILRPIEFNPLILCGKTKQPELSDLPKFMSLVSI